jgi:hypothetical protein
VIRQTIQPGDARQRDRVPCNWTVLASNGWAISVPSRQNTRYPGAACIAFDRVPETRSPGIGVERVQTRSPYPDPSATGHSEKMSSVRQEGGCPPWRTSWDVQFQPFCLSTACGDPVETIQWSWHEHNHVVAFHVPPPQLPCWRRD